MNSNHPNSHSSSRPNRLAEETSPYLLQHANQPVDWYPWGEEALLLAKSENKPIFLSVGYSACHWCHVMAHESFDDPEIAKRMNEWFVNIKVDREERPDIDQIYMNAVQLITRHGGWPMSVFLTPDGKPFYGGTYWPPMQKMGMPGFINVIGQIHTVWEEKQQEIIEDAQKLTSALQHMAINASDEESIQTDLSESVLKHAMNTMLSQADKEEGGFGRSPKFPQPLGLRHLLRGWKRFGSEEARDVVVKTLDSMRAGGIYDQIGGGFARYATDREWLIPHFEKMLYDNALLVPAYLEAYQVTQDESYAATCKETLDFFLDEMRHPEGGFYATLDADSEGVEGKFYVWSKEEIESHLTTDSTVNSEAGVEDAKLFCAAFDVTTEGNWEGQTILNLPKPLQETAKEQDVSLQDLKASLKQSAIKLLEVRRQRIAPGRDEKILTSWNGLMISALSQAAFVLQEPAYLKAAEEAADFVLARMTMPADSSRLLHSFKDGDARFNGYLDDYACFIEGLIDLYQSGFDAKYLQAAILLTESMQKWFQDTGQGGGFFYTSADHESLIVRNKEVHDNATPSGTNVAATVLLKLGRLCGRLDWEQAGYETLTQNCSLYGSQALAFGQALLATDFHLGTTYEIVLIEGTDPKECDDIIVELAKHFIPSKAIVRISAQELPLAEDHPLATVLAGKELAGKENTSENSPDNLKEEAVLYLCERGACQQPVFGRESIKAVIAKMTTET